ncbi:3-oxoacyl-ACP synthase III family protein [Ktedonospora formicarum]|uniref:3-oxoacyl-[acyl-carrier-protein] synthase 3 protein 1 n=1 Tax=Ktedonospora formicarum TaxID=2778364 RepID=A0A8J3I7P8_9CHLR|nr:3-oxoacyl-[acyl-carrier-protein] synthase III C-terminal domain-containing protein [Ktedonospora formicarum]GHO46924.1 3-oxoacyl-[acyl-carrier-protein] synthase 3 protein 1 [Ktedonospora formicarum]
MRVGIKGCGYSVPPHIRVNDDPIFQQITTAANAQGVAEKDLFTGMKERRYLAKGEQLETLMVEASRLALQRAQVTPEAVDRLYGYASVPEFYTPNSLYAVHRDLHLSEHTLVVPLNNEFSTFLLSVIEASSAITAGRSTYALVACGTNWTHYMDYTQGHALSVGDGAGSAVVGPDADFELIDYASQTMSEQYGAMTMQMRDAMHPTYKIMEDTGIHSFQVTAMQGLPAMVHSLLAKHRLTGKDIALITHQASRVLMDHWAEHIQPREYLDTLEQFGNLTLASYPVTLAYHYLDIVSDYLILAAVGVGYHQTAILLKRHR